MTLFLQATEGIDISSIASLVLPLAITALIFYFMLIRPESKRKKSVQKMLSELKVGDEVTTRGGIVGKIVKIKDDKLTIETGADKHKIQIMRWAVMVLVQTHQHLTVIFSNFLCCNRISFSRKLKRSGCGAKRTLPGQFQTIRNESLIGT